MQAAKVDFIPDGTVTFPKGFSAGATFAGIFKKTKYNLDLGILFSEVPCIATGLFTSNRIKSAPVLLSQDRLKNGRATALIVNSGCANACTGERGLSDAAEMAALAARSIATTPEDVLVASTGVIGQPLPMELIRTGIRQIVLSKDGGHELARAIMTTDTVPKETAVSFGIGDSKFIIGGIAKGSGMIHPNLGTMFCFLTTDAMLELSSLRAVLREAVDSSFNMISIDGDTSPSDTVLLMANGLAGKKPISPEIFQQALAQVCVHLAKAIARDGEGATKLIEVTVNGAINLAEARMAARTIVGSPLVKSAVHGADPNWGRIITASGRSGVELTESKIDLNIGDVNVVKRGSPQPFDMTNVIQILKKDEVPISLHFNLGNASATAWGCDLSEEYVTINSQYLT
ncbi:bifunctional glutamate N-acetyltransferase/amino-acid acetyltransferase ArgJ [Chloroflexota bacterium]